MTDTSKIDLEVSDLKKPTKEIPVVQDQGVFQHDTGDVYDGFFEAKKKDRSVKMHGSGTYRTAEGDVYTGVWESDKLGVNDEITIAFTDGAKFQGHLRDWYYNSQGKYFYPDGSILFCDFIENSPVGPLTLTDPNKHTSLGKAEQGYGWMEPVNHYYELLDKTQDVGIVKHRTKRNIKG